MSRRCIGLNPSRRWRKRWTQCRAKAQRGDIFCERHRDGLIGAVMALRDVYYENLAFGLASFFLPVQHD